jgi:signal transduction histidine kinase
MVSEGELSILANNIDEMSNKVVEAINERKAVETLKKELIANVSHDLRTPLTSIQGYAETLVLLDDKLSKEDKLKYTNFILSSIEKVKKLVDDLFEISKLESQNVKTQLEVFSIEEMISDIVSKYELISKSKDVDLSFECSAKNSNVNADIALINRVMQNLIDNAIKHTPSGGEIKILISSSNKGVNVRVKDTGLGIPEKELPYIFDRYRKGKSEGGTGLGLAIVKKILELHKSSINVISVYQKGTEFSFDLAVGAV